MRLIYVEIQGPEDGPYTTGVFLLSVQPSERYVVGQQLHLERGKDTQWSLQKSAS